MDFGVVMEYDVVMSYGVRGLVVGFIVGGGRKGMKRGMMLCGVIDVVVVWKQFEVEVGMYELVVEVELNSCH